jgi:drug/metabolite transporter (DMT)-like permease
MSPPDPARPSSAPDEASLARARQSAIILVLGSSATFTLAAAAVKTLDGSIPIAQLILFRNLFSLPVLLLMLPRAGGLAVLRPKRPLGHVARTCFGLMGMYGAFVGYTYLPLATATVLGFTMPLFLTALSVVLLRERVGWRRWSAVAVGFAGVALVARPGFGEQALPAWPVAAVLVGSLAWALAMMTIRRMGQAGENGVAIVLWFAIGSAMVSGLASIPVWVQPDARQWALLLAIGGVSAVAQLMMTEAYRRGETTLLAPFEYAALLWTMLLGALIWGELPGALDLVGFAVLVGAGLFIWWREARLAGRR